MTQKPEPSNEEAFDLHTMDVDEVNFFYSNYTSTTSCMSHQFPHLEYEYLHLQKLPIPLRRTLEK